MLSDLFHTPQKFRYIILHSFICANTELHQQMFPKGICGVFVFWCLIIFSNVSVLFISLFSILLKHTVCVQARISHPVNIDFPLQFIPA